MFSLVSLLVVVAMSVTFASTAPRIVEQGEDEYADEEQ
jgi:hypothetical protein